MMSVSTEHKCSGNFIFINFKSTSFYIEKSDRTDDEAAIIRSARLLSNLTPLTVLYAVL
jgi:hypothetical protein